MRRVKVVQVEGRGEVTVKEISVLAAYQAWNSDDRLAGIKALFADAVQPSFDDIKAWYPSEIDQVLGAWLEVNDAFFSMAAKLQMDGAVKEVLAALTNSLSAAFAASLNRAMEMPGTTGGPSS